MKQTLRAATLLALTILLSSALRAQGDARLTDYQLNIQIDPALSELQVQAHISLPKTLAGTTVEFSLAYALEIVTSSVAIERLPTAEQAGSVLKSIKGSQGVRYRAMLPQGVATLQLSYRGLINFALGDQHEQYSRGFRSTSGIIGDEGVYLSGASLWYPLFNDDLLTFQITAAAPPNWHLVSQGSGTSADVSGADNHAVSHWISTDAVDEIHLVGGPLVRYMEATGVVTAAVYLHEPNEALASKYLNATAQYIEMYRKLIGPYPYDKFALVENFWETGFGMPSFTLLGPRVIRMPWILSSSYPHEILHNWWGNSVFVDYASGNWSEGLTAYMADHLIQEQRGRGAVYRRNTLKKYRDFVSREQEFPLSQFRSRHSASSEATGYGKSLMVFHMLRQRLGDEIFKQALRRFYRKYTGKKAGFKDLQSVFEVVSGHDLTKFFTQWIERAGAPQISLRDVTVQQSGTGFTLRGQLEQVQDGPNYQLAVPLRITTTNGHVFSTIELSEKRATFELTTTAAPVSLQVDPEFDLFRLLSPLETAVSIGQIFGERDIVAVLPTEEGADSIAGYTSMAKRWQSDAHRIRFMLDTDIDAVPTDQSVWLFGSSNKLAQSLFKSSSAMSVSNQSITAQSQIIPLSDHSAVLVVRHPKSLHKAIGWIQVDPPAAFSGLTRKLPHYGKYSYLGFSGDEPANMVKGEWSSVDSPLRVDFPSSAKAAKHDVSSAAPARRALAELPPLFSREKLLQHVGYLADDALGGRGLGSDGHAKAADYIVSQFEEIGLLPASDNSGFRQTFHVAEGEDGNQHDVDNIIGVLPGRNPQFAGQAVIVSAHYDHLGRGWPDVRAEDRGKIHNGADDNASGVAILIELARLLKNEAAPERTIIFIAFTAEEAGLLGSRYYTKNPLPTTLETITAVVNLDTIGRLNGGKLSVFGADSATQWPHIFRGIGYTTGIASQSIATAMASSDHASFLESGVPAVHISSGANLDYHRPSDTVDKIDGPGMVTAATFVREAVVYLAQRAELLTATIDGPSPVNPTDATGAVAKSAATNNKRRVSVGTVPDFSFDGRGVRVKAVVPGSPAEAAGIRADDVLVRLAGQQITNLQDYADLLKTLEPEVSVVVAIERNGDDLTLDVTPVAR